MTADRDRTRQAVTPSPGQTAGCFSAYCLDYDELVQTGIQGKPSPPKRFFLLYHFHNRYI